MANTPWLLRRWSMMLCGPPKRLLAGLTAMALLGTGASATAQLVMSPLPELKDVLDRHEVDVSRVEILGRTVHSPFLDGKPTGIETTIYVNQAIEDFLSLKVPVGGSDTYRNVDAFLSRDFGRFAALLNRGQVTAGTLLASRDGRFSVRVGNSTGSQLQTFRGSDRADLDGGAGEQPEVRRLALLDTAPQTPTLVTMAPAVPQLLRAPDLTRRTTISRDESDPPLPTTFNQAVNSSIPDANPTGIESTIHVSDVVGEVFSVKVTLEVSGGSNGDLYAFLSHGVDGFAVLLNRVGTTDGNLFGYSDAGFNVTFDDAIGPDIHTYGGNGGLALTGTWAVDGRNVNPLTVRNTEPRLAKLQSLEGLDPNGDWTLFIADLAGGGGGSTFVSWGLEISSVPEPSGAALAVGSLLLIGALCRRGFSR